jgi:hypothetical protein
MVSECKCSYDHELYKRGEKRCFLYLKFGRMLYLFVFPVRNPNSVATWPDIAENKGNIIAPKIPTIRLICSNPLFSTYCAASREGYIDAQYARRVLPSRPSSCSTRVTSDKYIKQTTQASDCSIDFARMLLLVFVVVANNIAMNINWLNNHCHCWYTMIIVVVAVIIRIFRRGESPVARQHQQSWFWLRIINNSIASGTKII